MVVRFYLPLSICFNPIKSFEVVKAGYIKYADARACVRLIPEDVSSWFKSEAKSRKGAKNPCVDGSILS